LFDFAPIRPKTFEMSSWLIAVHSSGQTPHAAPWIQSRFVIGTEVADDIFTVQGEGIFPRHVRVVLGEQNATFESLHGAAQTSVQGAPLEGTIVSKYPVSLRIGGVDMLVDKDPKSPGASGSLDVASDFATDAFAELKEGLRFTPHNEAQGAEKYFQRTMAFGLETDIAPFGNFVTVDKIYELKNEIARGGMGHVFLAEDRTLNRQVALKVGHSADATQKAAFYREARILSHLSHPNIVPVHNFGEDAAGRPFYSMKLVRGQTLQGVIKNLREKDPLTTVEFSLQRLLSVFRRVCNAIEFAHSAGYLHRDMKPENVMIGEYGEVWVMDWGLAQALRQTTALISDDTPKYDRKFAVEGTPQYMSPEQAFGSPLDERTDIYSLGSILYAILTLQAPVQGNSLNEILQKVKTGAVSAMQAPFSKPTAHGSHATKRKGIPMALAAVVHKAMHLDSSKRYQHVTDLIRDIEAYQSGFATSAEDAGVIRHIGLLVRRHRALAAVLAFSLAGAVISAVRLAVSERDARAQAVLAKENERRADEIVSSALVLECAAVGVCKACRIVMTNAMSASTGIAENELAKRFITAPLTLEAPDYTSLKTFIPDWKRKAELIVLLSYGSVQLVNWISGARDKLGRIPTRDLRPWPSCLPLLVVSGDVANIAMFPNLGTHSGAARRPLEIKLGSLGALPMSSPLKLRQKFLMKNQFSFDPPDQRRFTNWSDETPISLMGLCNQCVDWTRNVADSPDSTVTGSLKAEKQTVRVYLGKQIVELDPMNRAFSCTILPPEN
jgi:serine/threonine protein kinase